jgi:ATP-dependent exoDNAse (exonuclease V) beta subunit
MEPHRAQNKLFPVLSKRHPHERDQFLQFDEPSHKYTITMDADSKYTSVTTWNHSHFPHFDADMVIAKMMKGRNWNESNKYWGQTPEQIKQMWSDNAASVCGSGTDMHFQIECFMNQDLVDEKGNDYPYTHADLLQMYEEENELLQKNLNVSDEWQYFLAFVRAYPELKPYRTEWMIFHEELKIAGSIDMVYENPDGTLSIYDWKRSKEISKVNAFKEWATTPIIAHLPHTNYWHYSMQLNTYKAILEDKYGKVVKDLYLVRLHPNNSRKTFDLIKCADLSAELKDLFQERRIQLEQQCEHEIKKRI